MVVRVGGNAGRLLEVLRGRGGVRVKAKRPLTRSTGAFDTGWKYYDAFFDLAMPLRNRSPAILVCIDNDGGKKDIRAAILEHHLEAIAVPGLRYSKSYSALFESTFGEPLVDA
jgi:hypothetical protein